jgi:hypothetical protein
VAARQRPAAPPEHVIELLYSRLAWGQPCHCPRSTSR